MRHMPLDTGPDVEHTVDVENHQQPSVQPMHARGHARESMIEIDRIILAIGSRQLQHLPDLVDQKAVGFAPVLDADR